jgi:hypothetical protein
MDEAQAAQGQALLGRLVQAYGDAEREEEPLTVETLAGTTLYFAALVLVHLWQGGQDKPDPPSWEDWRRLCVRRLGHLMGATREACSCGESR